MSDIVINLPASITLPSVDNTDSDDNKINNYVINSAIIDIINNVINVNLSFYYTDYNNPGIEKQILSEVKIEIPAIYDGLINFDLDAYKNYILNLSVQT